MLSIIIPAYNEAHQIATVVASARDAVTALDLDHEILVINDASTDDTERLARDAGATVVHVEKRQIAAVRNAGAAAATGSRFVFLDGDTFLNPVTLRGAVDAMDAGASGGGAIMYFDDAPLTGRVAITIVTHTLRLLRLCGGCFMFVTRDAFDASGGFDESLFASEEIPFARAVRRHGPFIVLRHPIVTSGRKMRRFSTLSLIWQVLRLGLRGPGAVRRREGLDHWYDGVR